METQTKVFASSFSPDGRVLVYFHIKTDGGGDIYTLNLDLTDPDHPQAGQPRLFQSNPNLQGTPARSSIARISPDGRWMAYTLQEAGKGRIYVRPFPSRSGKWLVVSGGNYPIWAANGRELSYENEDYRIMVVDYTVDGDAFVPRTPRLWCDKSIFYLGGQNLDLAPDGRRFAILTDPASAPEAKSSSVHVTMLLNFFDELRRRIP